MSDLFGDAISEIANGPHVGGHRAIAKKLMTRLAEKEQPLSHLADQRMMKLSLATLRNYAREFKLSFPDYVPLEFRKTISFVQAGDFFELAGPQVGRVAKLLGVVVTKRDGTPMCAVPSYSITDTKTKLKAIYTVKIVRAKKRKAAANG